MSKKKLAYKGLVYYVGMKGGLVEQIGKKVRKLSKQESIDWNKSMNRKIAQRDRDIAKFSQAKDYNKLVDAYASGFSADFSKWQSQMKKFFKKEKLTIRDLEGVFGDCLTQVSMLSFREGNKISFSDNGYDKIRLRKDQKEFSSAILSFIKAKGMWSDLMTLHKHWENEMAEAA